MCDADIINRLLETNEKMQRSNDKKFLALAGIYVLTVIGFFLYLSFGGATMRLAANETIESTISQTRK